MKIEDWRERIDEIDRKLVDLLNERARAARQIGVLKRDRQTPIYEPHREQQIFDNVKRSNGGPLPDHVLLQLYERIIDVMRKLQREEAETEQERATAAHATEIDAELDE